MANIVIYIDLPETAEVIASVIPKMIDAKDTYFDMANTMSQTIIEGINISGQSAPSTPMVVATPFPPLNLKNTVHIWPTMAENPMRILKSS